MSGTLFNYGWSIKRLGWRLIVKVWPVIEPHRKPRRFI